MHQQHRYSSPFAETVGNVAKEKPGHPDPRPGRHRDESGITVVYIPQNRFHRIIAETHFYRNLVTRFFEAVGERQQLAPDVGLDAVTLL